MTKELNLDLFYDYPLKSQDHKMEELAEVIQENEMLLKSYTILHQEARATENQKQHLIDWTNDIREQINLKGQKNNCPFLIMKILVYTNYWVYIVQFR